MEDRSESSMLEINKVSDCFPKKHLKPLSDRDKEFSCWEEVEKMGIDFYFQNYISRSREAVKQQRPSEKILLKEDRHITGRNRRIDRNFNVNKLKTKKMFKLCNTIWKIFTRN